MFSELEARRIELLAELREWSLRRLNFRAAVNTWSAVEVLDHVVRTEAGTIADVREGLRKPHVLGGEERPGIAALDRALRSDQSFQVPAGAAAIYPDAETTLEEVEGRWEEARMELKLVIEGLGAGDAECGVFEHPFAGWMTVADVLRHFDAHLVHHEFQMARLRESWEGRRAEMAIGVGDGD